jgi:putative aldouronate transport system substrate-binding protein
MRKTLKAMSLIALFVLIASTAFAGCATPTPAATVAPTAAPTQQAATPTPTATPALDTSKNVHLYGYLLGSALPGMQAVTDALNKKLTADLNCTMEINYIGWGDLSAKYPLILAAGEDVDWIYTAAWCQMADQSAKGAFMEMTPDLYQAYMPLHWAKIKDTTALKECSINGKDYMIPTSTPDKKVNTMIYRKDLATKYGIGDIKSVADLGPYLAAIKANEPGMIPMDMDNTYDLGTPMFDIFEESTGYFSDIGFSTGTGVGLYYKTFDKDGKLYQLSSDATYLPALEAAATTMKQWFDAGYINHDVMANTVRSKENFVAGKTAVAFGNSIDVQGNITSAVKNGYDVGIVPILDPNGKSPANAYTNNGVAICAKSQNWQRALAALDRMMEDESYVDLVYYGIKDTNYKLTSDGSKIDFTGIDTTSYPLDQAGFWWVDKNYFKPLTTWTDGYTALNNAIPGYLATDTLAAFSPDMSKIKTQLANCRNAVTQYLSPIEVGNVQDVAAAFKKLDDSLNTAGVADIKTEMDKQIQAYLAQ